MKIGAVLTVVRDAGCLLWGFGGIAYQQWTGNVNVALLMVYTAMLGLPGAIGLVQLARGKQELPPTAGSSSASPSSSSSPP